MQYELEIKYLIFENSSGRFHLGNVFHNTPLPLIVSRSPVANLLFDLCIMVVQTAWY